MLSVSVLGASGQTQAVDLETLETFLLAAPKDEVYRIKGIVTASKPPTDSDGTKANGGEEHAGTGFQRYILNWAFGRWTFTRTEAEFPQAPKENLANSAAVHVGDGDEAPVLRMTIIAARGEGEKWKRRIESGGQIHLEGGGKGTKLEIKRVL